MTATEKKKQSTRLNLESGSSAASTSLFELASLCSNERLDAAMCVRGGWSGFVTKVLKSLTVLGATEEDSVGTLWCAKCELIKGQALATRLEDASTSTSSESKSAHGHFWQLSDTDIISHWTHHDSNLVLVLGHKTRELGHGDRRLVSLAHVQSLQHHL